MDIAGVLIVDVLMNATCGYLLFYSFLDRAAFTTSAVVGNDATCWTDVTSGQQDGMDELRDLDQSIDRRPEVDAFSDFVTLVTPKLGQETARWKYDVWTEEKRLAIFTLKYTDDTKAVAAVDDCLCLQFSTQPSEFSTYSLVPTFSSAGQKKDASFIQDILGKDTLTSSLEVQTLLNYLDSGRRESDTSGRDGSLEEFSLDDAFSDLEQQVVPQFGQETAAWKYDVRRAERKITIFRLGYKDNVAEIADCLSLQFIPHSNSADLSAVMFIPVIGFGGRTAEASIVQGVLGKEVVTSVEDVETILTYFDERHFNLIPAKPHSTSTGLPTEHCDRELSVELENNIEEWAASLEEDGVGQHRGAEAEVEPSSPLRRSKRTQVTATKSPARKKRPVEEESEDEVVISKSSKYPALSKKPKVTTKLVDSVVDPKEDLFALMYAKSMLKLDVRDIPSLPVHEESGGTILSSQYWTIPATSREKLKCTNDIFVDKSAMKSLPNLYETASKDMLADSVTYGWMLLEHLLGGREAITQSFGYTSSGTCPIEKKELVKIVVDLCDVVLEHMQRVFSVKDWGKVRTEVLSVPRSLTSVEYDTMKSLKHSTSRITHKNHFPSDIFLRDHLKDSSYPDEGKVQVAHGFDFYVNEERLREIEEHYKEGNKKLKLVQRWGRFGTDIVTELVGGVDVIHKGRLHSRCSMLILIGEDLVDAVYLRSQKTFAPDEELDYMTFRKYIRNMFIRNDFTTFTVAENTGLMASVLFPSGSSTKVSLPSVVPSDTDDPPAEPGCNYWTNPAPHRTRLSPDSDFYVQTTRLAEYQRYLGPERTKKKRLSGAGAGHAEYSGYLKALMPYVIGGEEVFVKRLLQRRKAKEEGRTASVLAETLIAPIFEHIERLYEITGSKAKSPRRKLYDCVEVFSSSLLQQYDKGQTRWHFSELDERPKPEVLASLEAQEYWRKPAPDRTQIRPGHEVYIRTKILESIASFYGPGSKEACIRKYSYALMVHMLGGTETAQKLRYEGKFHDGFRSMFIFDDLVAVCLHCDQVFHLMFSISPTDSLRYATVQMSRTDWHVQRKKERAAKGCHAHNVPSTLFLALNV